MGVSWYSCTVCGETCPDCSYETIFCECGEVFCSERCSEKAMIRYYGDGDHDTSCSYCRKENFTNNDIMNYLLKKLGVTKENIIEEMKNND